VYAITWNLFHGRDHPPDPALRTTRSRLTRATERSRTHLQLNGDLLSEFTGVLARSTWDVALLQECPPRFAAPLAQACGAGVQRALTSRNWLLPLTQPIARRNPDLIASWEGGSNLTLVRGQKIVSRRSAVLRWFPERRVLALARLESGLCVANLHASERAERADEDVRRAAGAALEFAGDAPLLFGGDLNIRPKSASAFAGLAREGFTAPTAPDAIDHLMARGANLARAPAPWPPEDREVKRDGLAIRLSDHAPVDAVFELPAPEHAPSSAASPRGTLAG
jgi:endonuclease/exonuclease/phosphatase family metal-dependent hydrolase